MNKVVPIAKLKRLEFVTLSSYLSVCRTHSPSISAHLLGASRSGMSERLSKFEQWLNIPLFDREHKKLYVNQQRLKLAKFVLPLLVLEQFSQQCAQIKSVKVDWISVRIPLRFYGGLLTQALETALRHCQEAYPNVLVWPQSSDSYGVRQTSDVEWQPPWPLLGDIHINWSSISPLCKNDNLMLQGNWCILSHVDSDLKSYLDIEQLANLKLYLPRMPWILLQQMASISEASTWSFEHISQDYQQLITKPNIKHRMIIVNSLLIDAHMMSPDWKISIIKNLPSASLLIESEGQHPIISLFKKTFLEAMQNMDADKNFIWNTKSQLKHWRYLYQTLKSGSINAGAQSLYMSQPALSIQLKQLEKALGGQLFRRGMGTRQLDITPLGNIFYDLCQGINDTLVRMVDYSDGQRLNQQQHLSFGILPSVDNKSTLLKLIADRVTTWQERNPHVFLEIVEERHRYLVDALRNQTLHLAIIEADSPWVAHLPLQEAESLGLIINAKLNPKGVKTLKWQELFEYKLVLPRKNTGIRLLIDQHCLSLGITLPVALESDSLNINQFLVSEGRYATILPRSAVAQLIDNNKVEYIELTPILNRVLRIAHLANRVLSPTEQSLVQCLLAEHLKP